MPNSLGTRAQPWLVFFGLLAFALLMRAQTLNNPVLGFDEQFYLLVGDRMLHGAVPYVDIFDRKPVGLFLIYAAIRKLGGDGFVEYKLVACGFAAATSFLIYYAARPIGNVFAAIVAACLYILWLNLTGGEGGQAQVFYNLPVLAAGILTWRTVQTHRRDALGFAAMLLVGVAIQIKYTAVFEGVFFGIALLWAHYQARPRLLSLIIDGIQLASCALLPTALAMLAYWRMGALQPFIFANFLSEFGRVADPLAAQLIGLVKLIGVLSPLLLFCALSQRNRKPEASAGLNFPLLWLGAALLGVLLFGSFLSAQYCMPVLVPACIAAAPFFARYGRARTVASITIALAALAGQVGLARSEFRNGGPIQAQALAQAAEPRRGCIYVYDGYPALYMLTRSCLPTRWVFPGHLNTSDEDSAKALGVDPATEVRRILATQPDVIVDDAPAYELGNRETRALVETELARDYHLETTVKTGPTRSRLVYRLNTPVTGALSR